MLAGLLLLSFGACMVSASETEVVRKRVQELIKSQEFRGALDVLVAQASDLANAPADSDAAQIERRVADLGRLMSFNVTRLINAGSIYDRELKALREKFAESARSREFSPHTRPLVAAAMMLDTYRSNPKASIELYNLIPGRQRAAFNVDQYVFDYLWVNRRFDTLAGSLWADAILERQLARQKEEGRTPFYPATLRRTHVTAVARTIVAKRNGGRATEADALEQKATLVYTATELKTAMSQADAYVKDGPSQTEKSK